MNDFTKEELESTKEVFRWILADPTFSQLGGWVKPLESKIQSMIDNYCEHNIAVWPLFTATGDIACAGLCFTCNKCVKKEFIIDNQ